MNIAIFDFDFDAILTSEKVDSWHLKINDENIREISATPNLMTQVKPKGNPIQKKQRMYVRKAISTLLSHKEISKSSHRELKNACEEALKSLDEQFPINGGAGQNSSPSSPSSSSVSSFSVLPEPNPILVHVEKFFLPFELACRSKTPRIVCSALDSIEKLVAYGHISYEYFEVSPLGTYTETLTKIATTMIHIFIGYNSLCSIK